MLATVVAATNIDLSSFHFSPSSSNFYLWHSYLGHVLFSYLRFLVFIGALENLQTYDISDCSGFELIKFFALSFNQIISISSFLFNLIHSDV
jgi:hypothetical protein